MADTFGYKEMRETEVRAHEIITSLHDDLEDSTSEEAYAEGMLKNLFEMMDNDDEYKLGVLTASKLILEHYGKIVIGI